MSETIRETLETAFEAHEETPEPVAEAAPTSAPEPAASQDDPAPAAATDGRARDEKGRFAKAAAEAAAKAGEAPKAPPAPEVAPPAPPEAVKPDTFKAPQSWKVTAREAFNRLPPEVQAVLGPEFVRREQEISKTLSETAEARKFREQFNETVRPYESFIRAAGHDPIQTVSGLLQTTAALNQGSPSQVLGIVNSIIQEYGVKRFGPQFIQQLDGALAGQPVPQQQAPQYRDPRVDQLMARLQQAEAQRSQAVQQKVAQDVESFASSHEFFDDVRDEMADIIAAKAARGVEMSIEQAYNYAVAMHPEISEVMKQRQAAEAAKAQNASTQRSKAAGSSIRAIPAEPVTRRSGPRSIREDVEAAFASQR